MTALDLKRLKAWLDGEIDPPWELDAVPTAVLLAGLDMIVDEMPLLDRRTIFIDIARDRLAHRGDKEQRHG